MWFQLGKEKFHLNHRLDTHYCWIINVWCDRIKVEKTAYFYIKVQPAVELNEMVSHTGLERRRFWENEMNTLLVQTPFSCNTRIWLQKKWLQYHKLPVCFFLSDGLGFRGKQWMKGPHKASSELVNLGLTCVISYCLCAEREQDKSAMCNSKAEKLDSFSFC